MDNTEYLKILNLAQFLLAKNSAPVAKRPKNVKEALEYARVLGTELALAHGRLPALSPSAQEQTHNTNSRRRSRTDDATSADDDKINNNSTLEINQQDIVDNPALPFLALATFLIGFCQDNKTQPKSWIAHGTIVGRLQHLVPNSDAVTIVPVLKIVTPNSNPQVQQTKTNRSTFSSLLQSDTVRVFVHSVNHSLEIRATNDYVLSEDADPYARVPIFTLPFNPSDIQIPEHLRQRTKIRFSWTASSEALVKKKNEDAKPGEPVYHDPVHDHFAKKLVNFISGPEQYPRHLHRVLDTRNCTCPDEESFVHK